jgi:hypothetical protein
LPPRSRLFVLAIALLACPISAQGAVLAAPDFAGAAAHSITTIPSPLLSPEEVLSRPKHFYGGEDAIQRAMARQGMALGTDGAESQGVSTGKAILLNAVAPGAGHIYSGYNRGYLYLGMEAAAWVSYLVLRDNGNRRAELAEDYAGDPLESQSRWSFDRYAVRGYCNEPGASAADSTLRAAWTDDRETFYDLIEGDRPYKCGWEDTEAWSEFRNMRNNSNDFLRWAKYAGAAVILNHAVAVIDMIRLTQGFRVPGGASITVKVDPALPYPAGTIKIKKAF